MRTTEELEVLIKKFDNDITKRSRLFRLLLVIDQLVNVLLWNGSQDETISSHVGRRIASGKSNRFDKLICCFLNKIDNKHCTKSKGE